MELIIERIMMKKKVVLFGAYDRYNYGDNLMPILLEMYVTKYLPEKLDSYQFIHASISDSDLRHFSCFETKSINNIVNELNKDDVIIVVGGEVLCASNSGLFLHMPKAKLLNDFYTKLNRLPLAKAIFKKWVDLRYRTPWEYPYLPDQKLLNDGVKVKYNTIGGGIPRKLSIETKNDLTNRLEDADYLSVRDKRTYERLSHVRDVELYPDSAFIMSDLCPDSFLKAKVSEDVLSYAENQYIVFQAAPAKVGDNLMNIITKLKALSGKTKRRILLLPIGYAAGHDDFYLLNDIHKKMLDCSDIKFDLNVWEIMYLIKNGDFYMGTSLHGAITAMSFGKPHFGINKSIQKLNAFLRDWSISPYDHCYSVSEIEEFPEIIDKQNTTHLEENAKRLNALVMDNNNKLFNF